MKYIYQAQIQEALHRMTSKDLPNESDCEDDDASDHSEPPYLKEHLGDDSPEEDETSQKEQEHLTPIEATAKLSKFRPVISKPSDLKYLLECKADPNMPIPSGKVTPLRNIIYCLLFTVYDDSKRTRSEYETRSVEGCWV